MEFKPSQDLAYLGHMLSTLPIDKYVSDKFSKRQQTLLHKIIDDLLHERFETAYQLSEQIEKISPTYPPTAGLPELSAALAIDSSDTIRMA
jgi:hypothetical protein